MTTFADFGLSEPLSQAITALRYTTPTPIQAQAIPLALGGRDVLGIAQTGTGKTAAFALPTLERLAQNPLPQRPRRAARTLVLAPTRELAQQIADSFTALGRNLNLSIAVVVGGVPLARQARACAGGLDVLVATPGRLLDLVDQGALSLAHVEVLVLDEADQMLDLGFIHALRRIVGLVPARRQTLLFSATMPSSIADLAGRYLKDPARVEVTPVASTAERVEQWAVRVSAGEKQALLTIHLRDPAIGRALVFTRTKHGADRVVRRLAAAGIGSAAIHGNKSQPQREKALSSFRSGETRVLVATDIAARGIDVSGVSHVFNFEIPNVPEQYVHRIGRTARAGRAGMAVAYVADDERGYIRDIEKLTGQKLPLAELPANFMAEVKRVKATSEAADAAAPPREERDERGRGGGRPQARGPRRTKPAAVDVGGGREARFVARPRADGPVANPVRSAVGGQPQARSHGQDQRPARGPARPAAAPSASGRPGSPHGAARSKAAPGGGQRPGGHHGSGQRSGRPRGERAPR